MSLRPLSLGPETAPAADTAAEAKLMFDPKQDRNA